MQHVDFSSCLFPGRIFLSHWALAHHPHPELYEITGRKTDIWLVKTIGGVLAVIGAVLLLARARDEVTISIAFLAMGAAFALTVSEVNYVLKKVILPVYLLDAAIEVLLIAGWLIAL